MKNDINAQVKHVVSKKLGVEESKVKETSNLADDLGADSLDTVELVIELEEEFACEIPDEVAENIKTIQDIINYLKENVK